MRKVKIGLVAAVGLFILIAAAIANDSRPITRETRVERDALGTAVSAPGLKVASTTWELQSYDAVSHQIGTKGSGQYIHFAWTHWDIVPESLNQARRVVNFNTYNSASGGGSFLYGANGVTLCDGQFCDWPYRNLSFATMEVDDGNRAHLAFHKRDMVDQPYGDYSSFELNQAAPNYAVFTQSQLFGSTGVNPNPDDDAIWPHVSVDQIAGSPDVIHVVSHIFRANDNLLYWRFKSTDAPQWQGPYILDSTPYLSYNIACDPSSDKAALITTDEWTTAGNPHGLRQVTYRESPDNGSSWIDGSGLGDINEVLITNYNSLAGPEAWFDCVGDYDNGGNLHVVWNERRYASGDTVVVGVQNGERTVSNVSNTQAAWKHWDKMSGNTSTIHVAYHHNAGTVATGRINVAYPSLGFGDGTTMCNGQSNLDYIYITFVEFGGPSAAQQSDFSAKGFMNGDIYLSASADGGATWSPALNLTNTISPGCDPATHDSCQSENWPSIARTVDDTIHLMYIADRDAGAAPLGEGSWTYNPVLYYRIPGGTDAPILCPAIAPNLAVAMTNPRPDSAYTTGCGSSLTETLTVANIGPAALTGGISVIHITPPSGSWLTVTAAGPFAVVSGSSVSYPAVMSAHGLAAGLYQAEIHIGNDDVTKPNPFILPVTLEVMPGCLHQGDLDSNGVLDVIDVIDLIDVVFLNGTPPISDPGCPSDRGNVNCDQADDVMDIIALINHVFSDGAPPCGGCEV